MQCTTILEEILGKVDVEISSKQLQKQLPKQNSLLICQIANATMKSALKPYPLSRSLSHDLTEKKCPSVDPFMTKRISRVMAYRNEVNPQISTSQKFNRYTRMHPSLLQNYKRQAIKLNCSLNEKKLELNKVDERQNKILQQSFDLMRLNKSVKKVPDIIIKKQTGCLCCKNKKKLPNKYTFDYEGKLVYVCKKNQDSVQIESPLKTKCRKMQKQSKIVPEPQTYLNKLSNISTSQTRRIKRRLFDNGYFRQTSHIPFLQLHEKSTFIEPVIYDNILQTTNLKQLPKKHQQIKQKLPDLKNVSHLQIKRGIIKTNQLIEEKLY